MKSRNIYSLIIAVGIIMTACGKSFLDAPPQNVLPKEAYVNNLQACEQLMKSLYLSLSNAYGSYSEIYPELAADNIKPVTGATNFIQIYSWKQITNSSTENTVPQSVNLNGLSYAFYNLILSSNFLLERAPDFRHENSASTDNIMGVAYTMRAYAYFMLVNFFAQPYEYTSGAQHPGVVFIPGADWTKPEVGRATVNKIYQHITEDLQQALRLLPETSSNLMLLNKKVASALLSRVYLFQSDYEQSLRHAQLSIKNTPLLSISMGYPDEIFKKTDPNANESFFVLAPKSVSQIGNSTGGIFSNNYYQYRKHFIATADMASLLQVSNTDIRKNWVSQLSGNWEVLKFPSGVISDVNPSQAAYYKPLIRSSEMYLNAAEACFQLHKEDSALYYINQIVQRADPMATPLQVTGNDIFEAIQKERRKELAFEGLRLFDLLRWKQDIVRTDPLFPDAVRLSYPSDKAIAPLPQIDASRPGVVQNPGY
ncbi:RagB/SusD family nutrient uptake outer membrane protein [Chitinophaga barathri]|uniref:RagB/SusD family nutrient uptake outer membrane protein n=1 Tax=Chitinophaga barathri TaxID=1647451 RepID=A0A3N4MER2_9BACT|nr:RagB/SusD family nutrient uptake outer membrane protein [Chitinophaga barathri]RPD41845.1 RagB/SusD family nutrient uptake outer membrane protein [Chitinophaga barathri]